MAETINCNDFSRILYTATLAGAYEPPFACQVYESNEFSKACSVIAVNESGISVHEFPNRAAAQEYLASRILFHLQGGDPALEKDGIQNERIEWDDAIG